MPRILPAAALAAAFAAAASAAAAEPQALRVMTFNVWYGGDQVNPASAAAVIREAAPDIVAIQESYARMGEIAAAAGYPFIDWRRHLIARVPLFDSGGGEWTATGAPPGPLGGLDADAVHAWALVAPGRVVAVANVHLSSSSYGPDLVRAGEPLETVLAAEEERRMPEARLVVEGLAPLVKAGVPVVLMGDFNSPSHQDWTEAAARARAAVRYAVDWPVTRLVERAGFADAWRVVHPDPLARPGLTYSPGFPHPEMEPTESHDRIDYVFVAHGEVAGAALWGEAGNPDVDRALTPWPSDHRALVADLRVVPAEAPPLVAVEPRVVAAGDSFVVRAAGIGRTDWGVRIVPAGGDPATDAVGGIGGLAWWWQSAVRLSTFGLAPGAWDAVLIDGDGALRARTRFHVADPAAAPSLGLAAEAIGPEEGLTVAWSGAPGWRFDWLGIYRADDPDLYNYLGFAYTGALPAGEMTIPPEDLGQPLEPGDYVVRLVPDDSWMVIAEAPFRVEAAGEAGEGAGEAAGEGASEGAGAGTATGP